MKIFLKNRCLFILFLVSIIWALFACGNKPSDSAMELLFPGQRAITEKEKKMAEEQAQKEAEKVAEKQKIMIEKQKSVLVSHPTYIDRKCTICHEGADAFSSPIMGEKNWSGVFRTGGGVPGPLVLPANEICQKCHVDLSVSFAEKKGLVLHPTVAQGDCIKCHDPHQSRNPSILIENKETICITCHKEGGTASVAACFKDHLEPKPCLSCHNPHQGVNQALLTKDHKEEKHSVDKYLEQLTAPPASGGTEMPE